MSRRVDIDLYKHLNKDQLIATSAVQESQNYCSNKHSMVFYARELECCPVCAERAVAYRLANDLDIARRGIQRLKSVYPTEFFRWKEVKDKLNETN